MGKRRPAEGQASKHDVVADADWAFRADDGAVIDALAGAKHVDCLRDQALEVCSRVVIREPEDFRATSLETLRQMVVAGLGITLLPELAVESPFGSQRGLTIRQFAKPAPSRTVGAVWRKSSTRASVIRAVCDVVARVMTGKS